jgi:hypothetical protein
LNYKNCTICGECLPFTDEYFYKQKTNQGYRLASECKECARARSVKHYYDKHQECLDYKAQYRKSHKEEIAEYCKEWDYIHKDYIADKSRMWRRNNPEKLSEYGSRHRNHDITKREWKNCKDYFNNSCAYCGMTEQEHKKLYGQDLHKDHVDPDGDNDLSNCVPSCKNCNSEKHTKNLENWYTPYNNKYSDYRYEIILNWIKSDYLIYIKEK